MKALVLGTGLIGASLGAGLRGAGWSVTGWDPSPSAMEGALGMGGLDEAAADAVVGDDIDLVVLASPVANILAVLPALRTGALVTDVAGVKGSVVEAAAHLPRFVGGHPMAGRESSGPGAASAAMFQGATWILTSDGAAEGDLRQMEGIVESLGAVPVRMTAAAHDAAVAAVSHVPQVLASALVNLVAKDEGALALAAGGFRDVTRIALSEPGWWTDILTENRAEVSALIGALSKDLAVWADRIASGDSHSVADGLASARQARLGLTAPVATVNVLLEDHPGEIARIGQALTGVDVRDLQLRHATRGGGGVLSLSVLPGQQDGLIQALEADGFRIV